MAEQNGAATPQSKHDSKRKRMNKEAKKKRSQRMQYTGRRGDIVESCSVESYFAPSDIEPSNQSCLENLSAIGDAASEKENVASKSAWRIPNFVEDNKVPIIMLGTGILIGLFVLHRH